MIRVPRQLRRSDFPSSVPYYGGRLTPQVIAGMERRPPSGRRPDAAPSDGAGMANGQRDHGPQ
jgi:hypothetical protein